MLLDQTGSKEFNRYQNLKQVEVKSVPQVSSSVCWCCNRLRLMASYLVICNLNAESYHGPLADHWSPITHGPLIGQPIISLWLADHMRRDNDRVRHEPANYVKWACSIAETLTLQKTNKHCEVLVNCSDSLLWNWMELHVILSEARGTSCKPFGSSWNFM